MQYNAYMEEKPKDVTKEKKELTLDESFNMLVKLVRTNKLNYDEHIIVDGAVKTVFKALNDCEDKNKKQETKVELSKEHKK